MGRGFVLIINIVFFRDIYKIWNCMGWVVGEVVWEFRNGWDILL